MQTLQKESAAAHGDGREDLSLLRDAPEGLEDVSFDIELRIFSMPIEKLIRLEERGRVHQLREYE